MRVKSTVPALICGDRLSGLSNGHDGAPWMAFCQEFRWVDGMSEEGAVVILIEKHSQPWMADERP